MSYEHEKGGESFGSVDNLRMQIKYAGGHGRECAGIGDRLSRVMTEMMAAQGEIHRLEAQLAAAKEVQSALSKEKLKSEGLQRDVDKQKEMILQAEEKAAKAEEEVVLLKSGLAEKDALVERLKLELEQTKELNISCEKIASETMAELKKLKEEVELQEGKNWDQCQYISLLETEVKELMGESGKARDEVAALNDNIGKMKAELDQIKSEADRVLEAQVENALLKVELHKWRSKAAAAEAAEERSKREIFALTRALQLAAASQQESGCRFPQKQTGRLLESEHKKEVKTEGNNVTISRKEYQVLPNKADDHEQVMMEQKLRKLERELMTATRKIREFRTRAEQAISRAEAAEKAKAELEDKIKRRKEEKQMEKDFFEKLRVELNSGEAATPDIEVKNTPAIQTLSTVLEIPL